jgi:hypothetical protein
MTPVYVIVFVITCGVLELVLVCFWVRKRVLEAFKHRLRR